MIVLDVGGSSAPWLVLKSIVILLLVAAVKVGICSCRTKVYDRCSSSAGSVGEGGGENRFLVFQRNIFVL